MAPIVTYCTGASVRGAAPLRCAQGPAQELPDTVKSHGSRLPMRYSRKADTTQGYRFLSYFLISKKSVWFLLLFVFLCLQHRVFLGGLLSKY